MTSVLVLGIDPYAVPGMDAELILFEQVVNLVRRHAPGAAVAFNTSGADSVEAARRWL